jgi:peptidoglycan-N-acetylglucosamine deacetylase
MISGMNRAATRSPGIHGAAISRPQNGAGAVFGGTAFRALLATAGLAAAHAGPGITAINPVRRALFPALSGIGAADHVALTFDDGPDPASTPRFIELLESRQVRATFFLLGAMTVRAPQLAARLAAAGHEIGVHGWEHRYLPLRGPRATYADIKRARDTIARVTGVIPRFYRPPYGVLSSAALAATRRLGLTPVLWTRCGWEWRPDATPESVYAALTRGGLDGLGGATVLLHDSDCTSPAGSALAALGATARLVDDCRQRGLRVGPVGGHTIRLARRAAAGPSGTGQHEAGGGGAAGRPDLDDLPAVGDGQQSPGQRGGSPA